MTSPWSVPIFSNLVIPTGNGVGEARLVLASDLPPPLDTYIVSTYGVGYAGAIIFYSNDNTPPLDDTYTYIGWLDNNAIFTEIHIGHVYAGAVREVAPGVPQVAAFNANGSGISTFTDILADQVRVIARTGEVVLNASSNIVGTAGTFITLTAGALAEIICASIRLNGALEITGDINWGGSQSGSNVVNTAETTTSTAYVALATVVGIVFVAPPSGRIEVNMDAELNNSSAAEFCRVTFEIRGGSTIGAGFIQVIASDNRSMKKNGQTSDTRSYSYPVGGLTPGFTYNIQQLYKSSNAANTMTAERRILSITLQYS